MFHLLGQFLKIRRLNQDFFVVMRVEEEEDMIKKLEWSKFFIFNFFGKFLKIGRLNQDFWVVMKEEDEDMIKKLVVWMCVFSVCYGYRKEGWVVWTKGEILYWWVSWFLKFSFFLCEEKVLNDWSKSEPF